MVFHKIKSDNYIYFVSNNIGGLKSIIPLINYFYKKKYKLFLVYNYVNNQYLKKYKCKKLLFKKRISLKKINQLLLEYKPKFIFTSTTYPNNVIIGDIENQFVYLGNKNNYITYSFLDHWCGYKDRFFSYIEKKNRLILPKNIFVADKKSKKELSKSINVSKNKIIITGNPSWDNINQFTKNKYIKKLNITGINKSKKNILFISEVISEEKYKIKYDFNEFEILEKIIKKFTLKYNIIIKKHPREKKYKYNKILNKNKKNVFLFNEKQNILKLANQFDLIIGITSMLIIELKLSGFNPISLQPTSDKKPIIDFGFGIKIISSLNQIKNNKFNKVLSNNSNYHFNALDKILKLII